VWYLEQCQVWEYSATFLRWVYQPIFSLFCFGRQTHYRHSVIWFH
jgi:hypothetical protein